MTRALPASQAAVVVVLLASVALAGCRRRAAEVAEYNDPHPLPEDPLVVDAPGSAGTAAALCSRVTGNPRTFNAMMANETSSTDITDHHLFTFLVHYDNARQQPVPMIAKSWEVSPDGLTGRSTCGVARNSPTAIP